MKKKETRVILTVAVCLIVVCAVGLFTDRYRTVSEFLPGETQEVDLLITEVCTKNGRILKDPNGKYRDYIEVYNRGEDCNLRGFTLTDGKRTSKPLGDLPFAHGEYKVLFLGQENTGFSLSAAGGETIKLKNRDGSIAAQLTTVSLAEDHVMVWNGTGYEVSDRPTPGFPNTDEGYRLFTEGEPDPSPAVVISELLCSNRTILPDGKGFLCDLVELHNTSDVAISLSGYYLSDEPEDRFKQALPAITLPPDGYLVICCDRDSTDDTLPHVSFGLSLGETVVLTAPSGKYTSLAVRELPDDRSLLLVDGDYVEGVPSPGFANTEEGIYAFAQSRVDENAPLVINEVLLSGDGVPVAGGFRDAVEICNRSSEPVNTKGWYLTDGRDLFRYPLPEQTLEPGECAVVYCDRQSLPWHAPFGLSNGESLLLTAPDFLHGQPVICTPAGEGNSLSRTESDEGITYTVTKPSIGYANDPSGEKAFAEASMPEGLRISEVLSSNTQTLKGPYATCCDWVELYNASSEPISLSGYYLTDDADILSKGALPDVTVQPGEYFIVFLSKTTENLLKGYPVLPFALASTGDRLYLCRDREVVDYVLIPALPSDVSYGRASGEKDFCVLQAVTPGKANGEGATPTAAPVSRTPQGVYDGVSAVEVTLSGEGSIYYTLDCSHPTASSSLYTSPLQLTQTTVVRAICISPGKSESDVLELTYIINENHSFPVASIVTDPDNLWDYYKGIYTIGQRSPSDVTYPYPTSNYYQNWEREAHVSLFDGESGFSSPCGIRIFGAFSRALAQKSLSCFFRSRYGNGSLNYPLFGEEGLSTYEAFILRNTGQDFGKARMRDPMITDLVNAATGIDIQKNRPVVLYLNGEYWGIYYLREKINENYIAGNYNVAQEDVDLTRANGTSSTAYQELIRYVRGHDLSQQEAYDYVCSQVDIDEYIDYIIAEIGMAATDNGNIKFFKTTEGKWRWILYDTDQSFATYDYNAVSEHLNPNGTGSMDRFSTALINGLLKNAEFKDKFLRRFAWQVENIWSPENLNAYIDKYQALLEPEIRRDRQRWDRTYEDWKGHVNALRRFADNRATYLVKHVQAYFRLTDAQMRDYGFAV